MNSDDMSCGPIMRLFEVTAKPGGAEILLKNFATTSAAVVKNEPGNVGYFFGRALSTSNNSIIFASMWRSLDAIKERFGETWQTSYLPSGYEDLIEEC